MSYWVFRPFLSKGGGVIDALPEGSPTGWKWDEGIRLAAEYI